MFIDYRCINFCLLERVGKMENIMREHTAKPTKDLLKNIHKIYLLIAIIGGMIFSIAMPMFNEPDGQYHFAVSSAMVGLNTDISRYGEQEIGSGMANQKPFYHTGKFLDQYFLTKVTLYPLKDSPRNLDIENKFTYNYTGHIVPAVGVWLGYHIYPSMGVMVVVARLFSMLIYSLIMFFIIKHLKFGKLLFATISLSPVIMNSFSSLSYDSLGMVTIAAAIAIMIDMVAQRKVRIWHWGAVVALVVLIFIGSKQNLWLVNLLFPVTMIVVSLLKRNEQVERLYLRRKRERTSVLIRYKWWFFGVLVVAFIAVGSYLTRDKGGLFEVIIRLIFTQTFRFYPNTSMGDFVDLLVAPHPSYNYMPTSLIAVWGILVATVSISERAYHRSMLLSWFSFIVLLLGIFSTYYGFLGFIWTDGLPGFALRMTIQGVQWRYFTPLLLLLPLIFSNERIKFRVPSRNSVVIFMIVTAIVSNFLLVFNTLWGMIMV
ncbi:DUF2142 domain-containing protein [Lactococcus lactis subsp. lactis]|jgi:Predicted membrane protein (DUF2142).|nr:DUF2142 domain-containing protein [Lactococcus lactis subsp. lactis]